MPTGRSWYTYYPRVTTDGWCQGEFEVNVEFLATDAGEDFTVTSLFYQAWHPKRKEHAEVDLINDKNLTPLTQIMVAHIKSVIEKDTSWQSQALLENGWEAYGLGGNDPDGGLRYVG